MNAKTVYGWLAHAVGLTAVIAPALVGSVHPVVRISLIFAGFLCFFIAVAAARMRHRRVSAPVVFFLAVLLFFVILLQCIPLPLSWVQVLSPHLADLRERLGHASSPLAYDVPAALLEGFELLALAGFLFAAYQVTREGSWTQRMVQIVGFGGALLAAAAFFHHFAGVSRMYGIYTPQMAPTFFLPFVNSNHAAGYYILVFFTLLSLGIAEPSPRLRSFTLLAAALPFLAVLWTGSRAGIAALGAGVVAWRIFNGFSRDSASSGTAVFLVLIGLMAAIPLMDFFVAPFLQTPAGLDEDVKIRMWEHVGPLISDHFWTGTGPGAFSSVFPHYHALPDRVHMDYAENITLQFIADYGAPAAISALLLGAGLVVRYFRRIRMRAWKAGLLAGIFALAVQNLFDFNLEFPGTALPFAVILGVLAAQRYHQEEENTVKRTLPAAALAAPGVVLLAAAVVALPFYAHAYSLQNERENVLELLRQRNWAQTAHAAADAQRRHPSDVTLAAARGYAETFVPQGTPLRWIGLASWLFPRHPYPDLMAARVLALWKQKKQALLQYRLALEKGVRLNTALVRELRQAAGGDVPLTRVVPPAQWNDLIPFLSEAEREPVCREILQQGMKLRPSCTQILVKDALAREDWAGVERVAVFSEASSGASLHTAALRMKALHQQGRKADFERLLQETIRRYPRSGVMNAASMMLLCREQGKERALQWARTRLDSRQLSPGQAYFLAFAALKLQKADSPEAVLWSRRREVLASASRAPADTQAFSLLDFLWQPEFCREMQTEKP